MVAAGCGGGSTSSQHRSTVEKKEHLPSAARPGELLFVRVGCLNCHTYLGTGNRQLGAPDLSAEGQKHRGVLWQIQHLRCPPCLVRGSVMPRYGALGATRLKQLALFLEASKGGK